MSMTKNNSGLSAKRKREIDEMYNNRAILLMADKKVYTNEKSGDLYIFLSNFTPINLKMFNYLDVRFDLVQKNIEKDWLVKIWIDEDGLFHAEDMAPGENWFIEMRKRKREKLIEAFGECDESDIDNY